MNKVFIYLIVCLLAISFAAYLFYRRISNLVNKTVRDQQTMDSLAEFAAVIAIEAAQIAANRAQEQAIRIHMEAMVHAIDAVVHSYSLEHLLERWDEIGEDFDGIITTPNKPQRRQRRPVDWSKYGF